MSTITEPLGQGLTRVWQLGAVLSERSTAFQRVVIADTAQGVALFCDDERQSTEHSQLVYHEALVVPALLLAERVRDVLVIGSSEGVVSELAVAAGARRVDHVDIDTEAVRLCAEHLPYGYTPAALAAAENGAGPIRMHYADGLRFVADALSAGTRYDVIVIDLPDERADGAQHNRLYATGFLRDCAALLAEGGVAASQVGCPTLWRNDTLRAAWPRWHEVFGTIAYYGSDEHEWAFLFGTAAEVADPTEVMAGRLAELSYRPISIDAAALRGNGTAPHAVRTAATRPDHPA